MMNFALKQILVKIKLILIIWVMVHAN